MPTARMTNHARERCAEMGITTKVAKQIVREADVRWEGDVPKRGPSITAYSDRYPEYAVIYFMDDGVPVVRTVVFRTPQDYIRRGKTFEVVR